MLIESLKQLIVINERSVDLFNGNGLQAFNCLGTEFNFLGFVDDTREKQGLHLLGFEVFSREVFKTYPTALVLGVPGSPTSYSIRKKIDDLGITDEDFATVIHPNA